MESTMFHTYKVIVKREGKRRFGAVLLVFGRRDERSANANIFSSRAHPVRQKWQVSTGGRGSAAQMNGG